MPLLNLRRRAVCVAGLAVMAVYLIAGALSLPAQDADPARDALIVETLLRLDSFDLEAKPKTKAAV
ncbi:MAG TPA: hypothetical protein VL096_13740, partial [Pirellulaceae bacterium]|nr:hypothetical protein [Pirellulaceae bacterium]